jgi:hypothetical protein
MTAIDPVPSTSKRAAWRHWPILLGLATAAAIAFDLESGAELAKVLAASAVVYVGAAAAGDRRSTWPVFFLAFALIQVADVVAPDFEATWLVIALGLAFALVGLVPRDRKDDGERLRQLRIQGVAALGFTLAAVVAFTINETAGSLLVAGGLLAHAAWDLRHYRSHLVVARSLAEFCLVLDTLVALAIVVLAMTRN